MTSGSRANHNGAKFEFFVEIMLCAHKYGKSENAKELFKHRGQVKGKYYAPQVSVGVDGFGGRGRRIADFLLVNIPIFPNGHLLECKWQQVGGSADRKIVSTVNDVKTTFEREGVPTTVIYGGPGFDQDKIKWLKRQVGKDGLYAAFSMEDFQAAVNNGFLDSNDFNPPSPPRSDSNNGGNLYGNGGLWDDFLEGTA